MEGSVQHRTARIEARTPGDEARSTLVRDAVIFNVAFWILSFAAQTANAALSGSLDTGALDRAGTNLVGFVVTQAGALLLLRRSADTFVRLSVQAAVVAVFAVFACVTVSAVLVKVGAGHPFELAPLGQGLAPGILARAGRSAIYWLYRDAAWLGLFLALCYHHQVRARDRRLAAAQAETFSAQMRALRYQINPHFLFNTLNAIASLIHERAHSAAERMVLDMSTFFRTTLTLDPFSVSTLADEFALQKVYLDIERTRFPDRLTVELNLPHGLEAALAPSLILQPLVENAVKHGLAPSMQSIGIWLSAQQVGDRLLLRVENDMPLDARAKPGAGVGLANVRSRLAALYPNESFVEAGEAAPSSVVDRRRLAGERLTASSYQPSDASVRTERREACSDSFAGEDAGGPGTRRYVVTLSMPLRFAP
jgi:hypothetical protein